MKVAIITNIITSYREGFYDRLFNIENLSVTVYCQERIPGTSLKSIHPKYGLHISLVNHIGANNEKIGFQFLPIISILRNYDVIVLDGNPRTISNLILGILALFFTKAKVVMWSMGHSFGANPFTEKLRLRWLKLYKNIFLYTDKEVEDLCMKGFRQSNIVGMNNGLDQTKIDYEILKWNTDSLQAWKDAKGIGNKKILLSVTRLVNKNMLQQVIWALPQILVKNPDVIWLIVGAGEKEKYLRDEVEKLNLGKYVFFEGAIFCETELAPYFLSATLFIHPASIGLSIMHAFGYALPVVVNGNENMHGPEYAAFEDFRTGRNFVENDIDDLARVVNELLTDQLELEKMGLYAQHKAKYEYNVDIMVSRFINVISG